MDKSDQDSRRCLHSGVLYSFLSLWVKLLKCSLPKTCADTLCEKSSVDLSECTLALVRCLSLRLIPTACFSKAVSVLSHSLPASSQLVTCLPCHSRLSRRLAESVISVTQSLLSSVPVGSGVLLFGGTYCGQKDDGSSEMSQDDQWSVDGRGLRGVTLLIMKSCAVLMTSVDGGWRDEVFVFFSFNGSQFRRNQSEGLIRHQKKLTCVTFANRKCVLSFMSNCVMLMQIFFL